MKRLLITELWGVGDLAIASAFLRAAPRRYRTTLLAKPHAIPLAARLWPRTEVIPLVAPWTRHSGKYHLHRWPWRTLASTIRRLRRTSPDIAACARHDPRDHLLLRLSGAPVRIGYPRAGSRMLLTRPLPPPRPEDSRADQWATLARSLDLVPVPPPEPPAGRCLVYHSGAARRSRVWPVDRAARLVAALRRRGHVVEVLCDAGQRPAWTREEEDATAPGNLDVLLDRLSCASAFIGNDSGPGHLAAALGIPTFTIFGPQLPEWFLPDHPLAGHIEGRPCPHKPCFDSCRYSRPHCLLDITLEEVRGALFPWLERLTSK